MANTTPAVVGPFDRPVSHHMQMSMALNWEQDAGMFRCDLHWPTEQILVGAYHHDPCEAMENAVRQLTAMDGQHIEKAALLLRAPLPIADAPVP